MYNDKSPIAEKRGLQWHIASYIVVNLVAIILWWILTPDIFFWPLYSLGAWGIGLIAHIWTYLAMSSAAKRRAGLQ
jgi:2TM domain-containing protein